MTTLQIRPAEDVRWDCIALGEVMLRLDPGPLRIRTARSFDVWEGGGEYNVVRALRKAFGLRTSVITAITDNEIGHLLEELILAGGVDTTHVQWQPFDGVGVESRVGLNFTERGFGLRPARSVYDRGSTAIAQLRPGQIDWEAIFGEEGVRWFHTGGIYAGLSDHAPAVLEESIQAAKAAGTIVSYDLNYRASLWRSRGGERRAIEVNRKIASHVDVMIGNEEDFSAALGFAVEGTDPDLTELDPSSFKQMIEQVTDAFPNVGVIATTLRAATTANVNDWGAILHADGESYEATRRENLEIFDRVGGGDGFASGMIFALLNGEGPAKAVEYGAAHGALAMTTPGDTSMVTRAEVEAAMSSRSARVVR